MSHVNVISPIKTFIQYTQLKMVHCYPMYILMFTIYIFFNFLPHSNGCAAQTRPQRLNNESEIISNASRVHITNHYKLSENDEITTETTIKRENNEETNDKNNNLVWFIVYLILLMVLIALISILLYYVPLNL